ncbi:hypothetical protein NM22_14990 [Vibrio tubiashii]|nr:hypothetical protein NM22_14990 [Vibrio tubiashii]
MKDSITHLYRTQFTTVGRSQIMTPQQFETMRAQLKSLTPQQLRTLRGEINSKLDHNGESIVSDEELKMIADLFN